jgi:N-acetyl-1-D-myo-inositol-2-amino-2-deoxy-alpha-D-glucopyranoside deacetylase
MWSRLLTIMLAITLTLTLLSGRNVSSHTDDGMHIEHKDDAECKLCDQVPLRQDDLLESFSQLIRPLGNMLSAFGLTADDELYVTKNLRVIIFVPHPDDESIAAAGLMQRVLSQGGEVRTVFVTNGDGYPEAVRRQLGHPPRSSLDFREYGKVRRDEGLQALCELGVRSEDAVFLGFPDDGIDDLFIDHWSKFTPYRSPYTQLNCAGYKDSFKRWAIYAGVNLQDEIAKILEDFSPNWIVLPDPRDYHPDHCATGLFVLEAIRKLNLEGKILFDKTQVLTYLVHFKDYPASQTWTLEARQAGLFMSSTGCGILSSTEWLNLSLTDEELQGKERALAAHQSQQQMLGNFFKIFLHPDEIFGKLDPSQVLAIPQEYTAYYRKPNN